MNPIAKSTNPGNTGDGPIEVLGITLKRREMVEIGAFMNENSPHPAHQQVPSLKGATRPRLRAPGLTQTVRLLMENSIYQSAKKA